nr:hypothetical protein GZ27A8_6 [uncultured archaeon GZfos27A8]
MSRPIGQKRSSPGSSIGSSHSPGAVGCLHRNRSCRPETHAHWKERAFAFPWGVLIPACRRPKLLSRM